GSAPCRPSTASPLMRPRSPHLCQPLPSSSGARTPSSGLSKRHPSIVARLSRENEKVGDLGEDSRGFPSGGVREPTGHPTHLSPSVEQPAEPRNALDRWWRPNIRSAVNPPDHRGRTVSDQDCRSSAFECSPIGGYRTRVCQDG